MPATQHDALVWLSGSAYDVVFDRARLVIRNIADSPSLQEESSSWSYRHDRDLTGSLTVPNTQGSWRLAHEEG
jgi:putative iron-dependent peroxidase